MQLSPLEYSEPQPLTADNLKALEPNLGGEHEALGRFVGGSNSLIDRRRLQALLGVPSVEQQGPSEVATCLAADGYLSQAGLLAHAQQPQQFQDLRHVSQGRVSSDFGPPQQQRGLGRLSTDYEYVPAFQDSHWHSYVSSVSGIDSMGAAGGLHMPPEEFHSLGSGLEPRPKSPTVAGSQGLDQIMSGDSFAMPRMACGRASVELTRPGYMGAAYGAQTSQAQHQQLLAHQSSLTTSQALQAAQLALLGHGHGSQGLQPQQQQQQQRVGGGGAIGAIGAYPSGGGNPHMHPYQMHGTDHLKYHSGGQQSAQSFAGPVSRLIGPLPVQQQQQQQLLQHHHQQQQQHEAALSMHNLYGSSHLTQAYLQQQQQQAAQQHHQQGLQGMLGGAHGAGRMVGQFPPIGALPVGAYGQPVAYTQQVCARLGAHALLPFLPLHRLFEVLYCRASLRCSSAWFRE